MADFQEDPVSESDKELVAFIIDHCDRWKEHRDNNYQAKWDEYERLYYGVWSDEDKTRDSERSRLVSPAIRQAVENKTSEIIEATTGRGEFFEMEDDAADQQEMDIEMVKRQLHDDLKKDKVDILTDKVDILIDLMTKLTKQLGDKQLGDKQLNNEPN